MLRPHQNFARPYIDDIVVFFNSLMIYREERHNEGKYQQESLLSTTFEIRGEIFL